MKTILLLLAFLGAGGTAWGADDTPRGEALHEPNDPANKKLVHEHQLLGKAAYDRGDYEKACKEFDRAFMITPESETYYNLGLCNEAMGMAKDAVAAYRGFVQFFPNHPKTPEVTRKIAELEKLMANGEKALTLKKPSKALLATSLSLAGLAVGAGVAGGVLEYSIGAGIAEIPGKCTGFCEEYKAPLRTQRDAAIGLFAGAGVAGAAAVVTGVLYHVLGNKLPSILISSSLTHDTASISLGGTF